jgi:hypothetical protein
MRRQDSAYTKARRLAKRVFDRIENTLTRQMSLARERNKDRGSFNPGTTDTHGEDDSEDDIFGNVGDYVLT